MSYARPEEIRITRISSKQYEICLVAGFLETQTLPKLYESISAARKQIALMYPDQKLIIITQ